MSRRTSTIISRRCVCGQIAFTIDKAHIATTEDVTIAFSQTFCGTYLTAMNIHLRLSEYITIGIEAMNTTITKDVITLTATEDITLHMTIIYLDASTTKLVNGTHNTRFIIIATLSNLTTSDSSNLAATKDTVTDDTSPHCDIGMIDTTVIIVTATEEITTV